MEITTPALQIVGYQNSGKTTLIEKIIEVLSENGVRVGTIKHHGHGGFPDAFDTDKDTAKHRKAGAVVTGIEGTGMLQIHAYNSNGWSLDDMLSLYERLPIDLILIEGFKREHYPKIVLLRSEEDIKLLKLLDNVQAIICWYTPLKIKVSVPTFHLNDETDYLSWVRTYLKG